MKLKDNFNKSKKRILDYLQKNKEATLIIMLAIFLLFILSSSYDLFFKEKEEVPINYQTKLDSLKLFNNNEESILKEMNDLYELNQKVNDSNNIEEIKKINYELDKKLKNEN